VTGESGESQHTEAEHQQQNMEAKTKGGGGSSRASHPTDSEAESVPAEAKTKGGANRNKDSESHPQAESAHTEAKRVGANNNRVSHHTKNSESHPEAESAHTEAKRDRVYRVSHRAIATRALESRVDRASGEAGAAAFHGGGDFRLLEGKREGGGGGV
jgi:hypothetical protein